MSQSAIEKSQDRLNLTNNSTRSDYLSSKVLANLETRNSFAPVKLSSSTLRKAAELQERIEHLEVELQKLLQTGEETVVSPPATAHRTVSVSRKRGRRPARAVARPGARGRRSTSPSGPLAPAVVRVLKAKGSPMAVSDILTGLLSNGYKFSSPEPKKNLFARIYRLKGVKQVGPGRFAAA